MNDYVIAEDYTLPSLGKVYDIDVNPEVKIRSMTTEDEMKRLAPSEKGFKLLCEIIDDCLVEKPGISSYDMCLGDQQFLLHKLRVVTYGSDYNTESRCPYCGSPNSCVINLEDLALKTYSEDINKYKEFDLPVSKKHIKLRMQTPRMVDDVQTRKKEFLQKHPTALSEPAFLFTLESMIEEIDGEKLDAVKLEDFIRTLPMRDTNYIIKKSEKLNESIGLNLEYNTSCSVCGLDYKSSFRATKEFFGPDIDE